MKNFALGSILILSLCTVSYGVLVDGDNYLRLGSTGYCDRPHGTVSDLNYNNDFSVETIVNIEPYQQGGYWATMIQKGAPAAIYNATNKGWALEAVSKPLGI